MFPPAYSIRLLYTTMFTPGYSPELTPSVENGELQLLHLILAISPGSSFTTILNFSLTELRGAVLINFLPMLCVSSSSCRSPTNLLGL